MPAPIIRANPAKNRAMPTSVSKDDMFKTIKRLLGYVFHYYPWQFALVVLCIIVSSGVAVVGSFFIGNIVIDDYVTPALNGAAFDQAGFTGAIIAMAGIYLLGLAAGYIYTYTMAVIGQGVQKIIRDQLFDRMQDFPLSYFDQRTHGDIMSVYTNDVDVLREMFSRTLPIVVSSLTTMLACLVMMLYTDLLLTGIVILFAILTFFITQ